MKHSLTLICIASLCVFSGCGEEKTQDSKLVQDDQFAAYLELKRIPNEDEKRVAAALVTFNERAALAEAIEDTELLDRDLVEAEVSEFRKQMLISRYFEEYVKRQVGPEAVRNYYNAHPEEFQDKKIHVAHVLLRTSSRMTDDEKNARLLKAKEAYAKLQQNVPFEEVVQEYSEDRLTVQKGGDLGWLEEGAVDPAFSRVAFSMQEGEISEPFATSYGYHIVKVIEGSKTVSKPFEMVKGDIFYRLKQQAKESEMARLKGEAKK